MKKNEGENMSKTVIFALSASKQLAKEIAAQIGIDVGKCDVFHFADGEILVELQESVRGKNVYIVQSTYNPVSTHLVELLIAIDACKRASAGMINVVIPYFGYARQDRKAKPRQPITSKLVADLLQVAGAKRIITMDLHATQIQGFFDIPADDITAIGIIGKYFLSKQLENVVVVSPDHGGTNRARKLAEILHCPIAIIDKRRTRPNVAEAMNIIGDVQNKTAIVIDDIVDTAGTLTAGIEMLYENGAKAVYTACTHGVLSNPAIERIQQSRIVEFVCTNTIEIPESKLIEKIKVLSVGEILGKIIKQIEEAKPVSEVVSEYKVLQ